MRYIFQATTATVALGGISKRIEVWIGVDVHSPDDRRIIEENGYALVPAEDMTPDELRSVGVEGFRPLRQ